MPAIVGVLPRHSELSRKRAFEHSFKSQVLGANLGVVGVIVPVDRPPTHNRLEHSRPERPSRMATRATTHPKSL